MSAGNEYLEGKPPKKKSPASRRGRPRDERVQHVIEIVDWEWDYMFGIDTGRFNNGPYMDYRHLNIEGTILRPTSIKASAGEVTLFPDHRLSDIEGRRKHEPKAVGAISHRGKDYQANLHLPADAFGLVLQMMIAGRYRYVLIEAHKSFRGEALIRHFRFSGTIDEDDLA
ncbi:hypothetical protein LJR220_005209 [Bradyrhizobium sp. LjRoot220]|uniref:hypothetical protein n=1 Tax=Bradyrhizobium sp. LjRoot220 TaxID=3342284 RepID=UPI003ECE5446